MTLPPSLSRKVALASIPQGGKDWYLAANEVERTALAEAYGLLAVEELSATLILTPEPKGIVAVGGRVHAEIVQACVVTLEPVEQVIDEPVEARFTAADGSTIRSRPDAEVKVETSETDPPEILAEGILDLGAVAVEHFVLAIDPYPRAPGAALPADPPEPAAGTDSPFAALAGLREKVGKGG